MSDTEAQAPGAPSDDAAAKPTQQEKNQRRGRWWRGEHTNFAPTIATITPPESVFEYVLKGYAPEGPMIAHDTRVTAFGSCFAQHISNWLSDRSFRLMTREEGVQDAYVVRIAEGLVNTYAIRQQFEWAWEGKAPAKAGWYGYQGEAFAADDAEAQEQTRRLFDNTDVFILTFGLSEVWSDKKTGDVYWRGVPRDAFDPERHEFRLTTVEENVTNLRAIYALIRKHRPDAKMIFTLSPIPLTATFRNISCIPANAVSKATLRVALDTLWSEKAEEGHLYYWPSYELVTDVFHNPFRVDRGHVEREVLDFIMTLFEHVWCDPDGERPDLLVRWCAARAAAGLLPPQIGRAIRQGDPELVEKAVEKHVTFHEPAHEAATRDLLDRLKTTLGGGTTDGTKAERRARKARQTAATVEAPKGDREAPKGDREARRARRKAARAEARQAGESPGKARRAARKEKGASEGGPRDAIRQERAAKRAERKAAGKRAETEEAS